MRKYRANNPDKVRVQNEKQKPRMKAYRQRNSESLKGYFKEYYRKNPERKKLLAAQYRKKNFEKIKARSAANYEKNKAEKWRQIKEWQAKNPEKYAAIRRTACLNRLARLRNAEGRHAAIDIRRLYDKQHGKCNVCGDSLNERYDVDHVLPLSRGGSNWPENIQLLCPTCNRQKGAKTMEEFLKIRNRKIIA